MSSEEAILGRSGSPPDAMLRYGESVDQVADLRIAPDGASRPLIVLLHGGFWKPEYDRTHTGPMATAIAAAGWSVLTVEYRRIPGNPDATLHDVLSALEQLPKQITEHNGEIILLGHSAGGQLALWAAANTALTQLRGIIALAPTVDLRLCEQLNLGGGAVGLFLGGAAATRSDADPMQLMAPSVPVTILHGEADDMVPLAVSQSYARRVPSVQLIEVPGADHYALIDPTSAAWNVVVAALERVTGSAAGESRKR